jgi:hypothetical protein
LVKQRHWKRHGNDDLHADRPIGGMDFQLHQRCSLFDWMPGEPNVVFYYILS